MRLVRKQLYRAFPELDRFDDAACQAFVRSVSASWRGKAARKLVQLFLCTGAMILALQVSLHGPPVHFDSLREALLAALTMLGFAVTVFIGFIAALLARDFMLRWSIRRRLRHTGLCSHCRYPLFGLPVDAASVVRCTECGTTTIADSTKGEVVPDLRGVPSFVPRPERVDAQGDSRRKLRHKRFVIGSALAVIAILLLVCTGVGIVAGVLYADVRAVRRDVDLRARLKELQTKAWPEGIAPDAHAQWARISEIDANLNRTLDEFATARRGLGKPTSTDLHIYAFDPLVSDAEFEKLYRVDRANEKAFIFEVLAEYSKHNLPSQIDQAADELSSPVWSVDVGPETNWQLQLDPSGRPLRSIMTTCVVRMQVAAQAQDAQAFARATSSALRFSTISMKQGVYRVSHFGHFWSSQASLCLSDNAELLLRDPTAAQEVIAAARKARSRPDHALLDEFLRLELLASMRSIHSDPVRVVNWTLGLDPSVRGSKPFTLGPGRYTNNVNAINRHFDTWAEYHSALSRTDGSKLINVPLAKTGRPFPDLHLPLQPRQLSMFLGQERNFRIMVIQVECIQFHIQHGRYPASMQELLNTNPIPQALLIDPVLQQPFRLATAQERIAKPDFKSLVRSDMPQSDQTAPPQTPAPPTGPASP